MFNSAKEESGFTMVEMLVVLIVIAILAAVAIPVFLNQRKEAQQSAVQSDLKNASLAMETERVSNNNHYPSYLPNYNPRSDGVTVSLVKSKSTRETYCLKGVAELEKNRVTYFDSGQGGMLDGDETCTDAPAGTSVLDDLAKKKVLVIEFQATDSIKRPAVTSAFQKYGITDVTYNDNPTAADLKNYDVVAAFGSVWPVTTWKLNLLRSAYASGAHVLTDSNDLNSGNLPHLFKTSTPYGQAESRPTVYQATGNSGLNPSFPYTFKETAFNGDSSWMCNRTTAPGAVAVATSPLSNNPAITCITAAASTNSAGGRWMHMTKAPFLAPPESSMLGASLDWLIMK